MVGLLSRAQCSSKSDVAVDAKDTNQKEVIEKQLLGSIIIIVTIQTIGLSNSVSPSS